MEWLERLNDALTYMEDNLAGEIQYERAAQLACCSVYHFQRMFSYITGVTLAEYLRRRRMTAAAFDLQAGDRVLDVALRYGYESPTSFNRAFQSVHGMTPSAAQKGGVVLKAFPRITFQVSIKGEEEMEYRIEKREAFSIVGVRTELSPDYEIGFQQTPKFWQKCAMEGVLPRLAGLMQGKQPQGILGVSTNHPDGKQNHYYIAVAGDGPAPEGMHQEIIPAGTWAIFSGRGELPSSMQEMQKRIVAEWLPTSGYEWAEAPDIEVYLSEPEGTVQSYEIWLPIVKKN